MPEEKTEKTQSPLPDPDKEPPKELESAQTKNRDPLEEEELEHFIKQQQLRDSYRRSSKLFDFLNERITTIVGFAVFFGVLIAIVYLWNIAAPESWRWLDPDDGLAKIEALFTSSLSFLTGVGITFFLRFVGRSI